MLVYDPNETFIWQRRHVSNDGGQRIPLNGSQPANLSELMREEFRTGEVMTYGFGPDPVKPKYSYLKGDITRAYTDKVRKHQRAFVFLNTGNSLVPAVLIVHDYIVSSNADFKKTWLLHSVQEPTFNGNVTTIVRNERGYNGKLVNTTLLPLPSNTSLTKVGGFGNEFSVGGINFPQQIRSTNNSWDGAIWRVELSPVAASQTDVFLNVMQVTNADNDILLPVEAIETDRMTGVQIGDWIVLFSKNGAAESLPINLIIEDRETFNVLITDLEKGNWEITGSRSSRTFINDNNLLYFEAAAGNYIITKK